MSDDPTFEENDDIEPDVEPDDEDDNGEPLGYLRDENE